MLTDGDWDIPKGLPEAYERLRVLRAEIQEIEAQLGDRNKRDRTPFEEFYAWRQSAKWAACNRLEELRLIKQWVKENQGTFV